MHKISMSVLSLFILFVALFIVSSVSAQTQSASIAVQVDTDLGNVNKNTLSSAMAKYTNQEGVWDVAGNHPVSEMVSYAKGMGMKFLRYQSLQGLDWKSAVGLNRTTEFGLPEYLQFCESAGATPIIVVSDFLSDSADAADLVEYLNAPDDGSNPNGGTDWAQVRSADGRSAPWNVIWFEFGNESWARISADSYISAYLDYQNKMKAVNSTIQIKLGAVLRNYFWQDPDSEWNAEVIPGTGSVADFYIIHTYMPKYDENCCNAEDNECLTTSVWSSSLGDWYYPGVCSLSANDVFKIGLTGVNDQLENYLSQLNRLIFELTGREVGIAVTEFNGHFVQDWYLTHAYRHSLGNALINADFIRQFMHADNILISNFWQFANDYWGMVVGPNSMAGEENRAFGARPTYYPFYFYHNYFGDTLIDVTGDIPAYTYDGQNSYVVGVASAEAASLQLEVIDTVNLVTGSWSNVPVAGSLANVDGDILRVDFTGTDNVDYDDSHITVPVEPDTKYRLSGLIQTNNLGLGEGAYLAVQTSGTNLISDNSFENATANWPYDQNDDWFFQPNSDSQGIVTNIDFSTSYSGVKSAFVNFSGDYDNNFYHIKSSPITVQPNTAYTLEGYIKTNNIEYDSQAAPAPTEWYGIMLSAKDNGGACNYGSSYTCWALSQGLKGTQDWSRVSKYLKTASYTNQIIVQLRRISCERANPFVPPCPISGDAWWDDLKLSEKITTDSLNGTRGWRYVHVDFNSNELNNPSVLTVLAGGNARGDGIQDKYAQFKDVHLRKITQNAQNGAVPYLSVNASRSADSKKVYLMVVNKHMTDAIATNVTLNNFNPSNARAWTLNDWSADNMVYAGNESSNNVYPQVYDLETVTSIFDFTFPPHSLTALVIYTDSDGDGYTSEIDCNDDDPAVNPGATEICDGIDNDCSGEVDDIPYYRDQDGDGYGNPAESVIACNSPEGYVLDSLDCDDGTVSVNPGAAEICDDGLDNDCDGTEAICNPTGWYNDASGSIWNFRRPVSIDAGMTAANLVNFPVLVKIDDVNNPVFANAHQNGHDIVFTLDDGVTKLDHELEKYDAVAGLLYAWVRIPELSPSGNLIYIYYGNPNAPDQQAVNDVWNSSFVGVWHLSETSGQHRDSTFHGYDSSSVTAQEQGQTAIAKIGGADFLTSPQKIKIADPGFNSDLDMTGNTPMTLSAWIRPSKFEVFQNGIITKNYSLRLDGPNMAENCNTDTAIVGTRKGNWGGIGGNCGTIDVNTWHHVVYVYEVFPGIDDDMHYLYIDGQLDSSSVVELGDITETDSTRDLCIASGWTSCDYDSFWDGYIDEVRISSLARSAEWIVAEFRNQNNPDAYIQFATPEIYCRDEDGDGYSTEGSMCGLLDCNDSDPSINPDAVEVCDWKDNNCDGNVDDGFDPGSFSLKKAEVEWNEGGGTTTEVKVNGEVVLNCMDYHQLNPAGSVSVDISGATDVINESVTFTVKGGENNKWEYESSGGLGINKFKIDWKGAKFDYDGGIRIKSEEIGFNSSEIEIDRKSVTEPITILVNNVTITIDGAGSVTVDPPADEIDVDDDGEIEVDLPFTITPATVFSITYGTVNESVLVGDYYTFAVGKFKVKAYFDSTANGLSGTSTPRTLDLEMGIGDQGFIKNYSITDTDWKDLTIDEWKYKVSN